MSHAQDSYYIPSGSHWPVVGSIGLLFLMVGVSSWLNGADSGFWVMMFGLAVLFLVVCLLNTIGLLLAKVTRKSGDVGLRRALGATRMAILRYAQER